MKELLLKAFAIFADGAGIEAITTKMQALASETQDLLDLADKESRELTDDELTLVVENNAKFEKLQAQLDARKKVEAMSSTNGPISRQTAPAAPAIITSPVERDKGGFTNMGEFARAVQNAADPSLDKIDPRLVKNAPSSYGQEGVGVDGGFLVPDDYRQQIWTAVTGEGSLISMCDEYETASNSVAVPVDNIAPWDDSNGIQCYWDGEADQITQSKPKIDVKRQALNRLTALVPVTDELLEDAPMLGGYLGRKAPEKMRFKTDHAIIGGTGVGQPLGILNAGSTIEVAKESGQAADTIVYNNVTKMYSRLLSNSMSKAVFIGNQDIIPELMNMVLPTANGVSKPAWVQGDLSNGLYDSLVGRRLMYHEGSETLGDKGDLILADLSRYMFVRKAGQQSIKQDVSMHLYFDYNMTAFRFVWRLTGSPWLKDALTPRSGSANTLSTNVVLANRA